MNLPRLLVILGTSTLLAGCLPDRLAPDGNAGKFYQRYEGVQTNWPTANGAYVTQQGRFTVIHGQPSKPYIILGRFDRPNIPMFRVARVARQQGADAIMLAEEQFIQHRIQPGMIFASGGIVGATATTSRDERRTDATAYLIKYQPVEPASTAPQVQLTP